MKVWLHDLMLRRLAVREDVNVGGRWRDTFFENGPSQQRVDKGAFARIELADHDQQEHLVELVDRLLEGVLRVRGETEISYKELQIAENSASGCDELALTVIDGETGRAWRRNRIHARADRKPV